MKTRLLATLSAFLLGSLAAFGSGMLIPSDQSLPPLAIQHQRVDIQIKDGVATSRVEQVFRNNVNRQLEAVYVFPLPENATIADFAMYIGGKRVSGELVEKDKARRTYEDIVRRMKDPGLLEHIGGNLFRVSVFPVPANGEQKIELEYSQTLTFEAGLYSFVYPLKTGEKASRTLADFTVSARINSKVPIRNIYSPSHKVGISRKGQNEAVIGFEEDKALLDRDFVLYYGVSQKEFGLNLLTHAAKGDKGFFMMMISPSVVTPETAAMKKDVVFVFDTSGSMQGNKIEQARRALQICVKKLNDGDRFNVIRFSTDVETFRDKLTEVNEKSRNEALEFISKIEARGGTAIDGALATALGMDFDSKRPAVVLFLTDGKPTIGETSTDTILGNVGKLNKVQARLFVFGVGVDVNTHLLDKASGGNGGISQYVSDEPVQRDLDGKPVTDDAKESSSELEAKVGSLVTKMSHPVLAKVRVEVDRLKTLQVHPNPANLPDFFSGDQITIFGRYDGSGDYAIRLLGEVNGKSREFVYEGTFPAASAENRFIPRLWATRRVGYLLDEIRLRGENVELKDEVVRLSREYGIMTPYTSYLVLENDQAYVDHGIKRQTEHTYGARGDKEEKAKGTDRDGFLGAVRAAKSAPAPATRPAEAGVAGKGSDATMDRRKAEMERRDELQAAAPVPVFEEAAADAVVAMPAATAGPASGSAAPAAPRMRTISTPGASAEGGRELMKKDSGEKAVQLSQAIHDYKAKENAADDIATVKQVGKKVFSLVNGRWIDNAFKKEMKTTTVKFGSDEYFKLLKDKPALKDFFALGEKVTVVLDDGTALVVE